MSRHPVDGCLLAETQFVYLWGAIFPFGGSIQPILVSTVDPPAAPWLAENRAVTVKRDTAPQPRKSNSKFTVAESPATSSPREIGSGVSNCGVHDGPEVWVKVKLSNFAPSAIPGPEFVTWIVHVWPFTSPFFASRVPPRDVGPGLKFAVTDVGPDIVTVVEAIEDDATGPVQLSNTYPALAVACTGIAEPASK